MNGICKVCGCDDLHACHTPEGPCHWVLDDLCSACVIKLKPGEHAGKYPDFGLIIEKMCRFCAHLIECKGLPSIYENYWGCDAGRIDERMPSGEYVRLPFKRSGFERPNRTVKAAQAHCPDWQVHPRWLKPHGGG
jgi:hypothetical protein